VRFEVVGGETELDRRVLDQLAEVLLHLVRNAVDHGIETPEQRQAAGKRAEGVIVVHAEQRRSEAIVVVRDDGRGIDLQGIRDVVSGDGRPAREMGDEEALQMIFSSGFSTSAHVDEVSGRGVGLDVVRSRLEAIQGRVEVRSHPGRGAEFRISVPLTLAVVSSLLVSAGGQRFALPMQSVVGIFAADAEDRWAGGRSVVVPNGQAVPLAGLAATLGLADSAEGARGPMVLLTGHTDQHGFTVDEVLGQRQVVVKGLSRVLPRLATVLGASVEPDGPILLVLEAAALIERAIRAGPTPVLARPAPVRAALAAPPEPAATRKTSRILVVDDAMIVREVERSILEQAGYEVVTASDGVEALAVLAGQPCDLVVTDVDMPRMDGMQLTTEIRRLPKLARLPVIMLTARADEETHRRGLEAGADGYVVKSAFDRPALLSLVRKTLGHG
jgi:two-component system chemotaxis sensor kinase CheA